MSVHKERSLNLQGLSFRITFTHIVLSFSTTVFIFKTPIFKLCRLKLHCHVVKNIKQRSLGSIKCVSSNFGHPNLERIILIKFYYSCYSFLRIRSPTRNIVTRSLWTHFFLICYPIFVFFLLWTASCCLCFIHGMFCF